MTDPLAPLSPAQPVPDLDALQAEAQAAMKNYADALIATATAKGATPEQTAVLKGIFDAILDAFGATAPTTTTFGGSPLDLESPDAA